ncbi:putative nucleic acid-binding, OB-fold protein [Vibrio phage 249E41-1]|nr:putative nucleic acid-binding, OB-fold protein [Vibrio phage 249E41-1]
MNFENHQVLYKVSVSTGKMQTWEGWTVRNEVCCAYGQLGGKIQTQSYKAEGKNIGRSNETSDVEQAIVELQAMYESQISNKHYRVTQEEAKKFSESNREPRKVTNYKDRYNKMSDTLLTSIKKDGSRACVLDGVLYSKIGRPEEIKVKHLKEAVEKLHELGVATFDGEVYAEGLSLQRIRSAWLKPIKTSKEIIKIAKDLAKKRNEEVPTPDGNVESEDAVKYLGYNPNEDAPKLKFWVFDIPDTTGTPFVSRSEGLFDIEAEARGLGIIDCFDFLIPKYTHSHKERMEMLEKVCAQGSEGLVHYEPEGVYEFGKRSTNTCKSKPRYDSEARIVNVTSDKSGQGVLHLQACDALENVKFKAKMKGDAASRAYNVQKGYIGKWVTFSYEDLSGAGIPTKPVAERLRACDEEGNPLN